MLELLVFPAMGTWVSKGVFGMYDFDGNGAGLVSRKNGASAVFVGPIESLVLLYTFAILGFLTNQRKGRPMLFGNNPAHPSSNYHYSVSQLPNR